MAFDAILIGGSFAGLSAALQLARARRKVLVIDSGRPRNRFAAASHGFLGQDGRPPLDILAEARRQLELYPTVTFAEAEAASAEGETNAFTVTAQDGQAWQGRRLVLATGLRDELPAVPGLQERWGLTVAHCPYCHGYEARDGQIGVLGNHPASAHQAVMLPDWGPTTYFTQGKFEPDAELAAMLAARGVTIERSPIVEVLGDAPSIEAVRLADGRAVPIQTIFTAPTLHLASPLAEGLGCAIDAGPMGPVVRVNEWGETSVAGVLAAGDAAVPRHSVTFASASGALAGVGAHRTLFMAQ